MKKFLKALLGLFIVVVILIATIFVARFVNHKRYPEPRADQVPPYVTHPQDLSNYPTQVDGLVVEHLDQGHLQGFHLRPAEGDVKPGVVVVYGGSEGSPDFDSAIKIAKEGHEVLSLFMFGQPNLQPTLLKIPLEQFGAALDYIDSLGKASEPLMVMGTSKGAEYALNLASKYPEIDTVIARVPSAYTFNGLDMSQRGSSWTWKGEELPYVDVTKGSFPTFIKNVMIPSALGTPVSYRDTYTAAVEKDPDLASKTIAIDQSKARIVALAATADAVWDSSAMAKTLQQIRPENTEVHVYEGAGHIFRLSTDYVASKYMVMKTGGSAAANQEAYDSSWEVIFKELDSL